jgi:heme-degrading monooxygenase HmoA
METEIMPLLRQQNGFIGELAMANPGSMERIAISLWESRADAEAYEASVYPQVLKILGRTIEGRPVVHSFETVSTTFHKPEK